MSELVEQTEKGRKAAVKIYVNTREHSWVKQEITFEEVYQLAFPTEPIDEGDVIRVEYSHGPRGDKAGKLQPGERVTVKKGMIFDAYVTVRS